MPEIETLVLFIAACLVLLLTPGPAVAYIVARSIDQGTKAGIVSVLGIAAGTLVHIAAASAGLSAVLVASPTAYLAVQFLGAAYLVYLGTRKLREPARPVGDLHADPAPLWTVFREGAVVNLLNPKTTIFFFAFLPQFIDPGQGSVASQILVLGLVLVVLGVVSDGAYAVLAGAVGSWLRKHPGFQRIQNRLVGGVYLVLGLLALVAGVRRI